MTANIIKNIKNTFTVTPTLDTSAYDSGDFLAGPFLLENIYTEGWGDQCVLKDIKILDQAKQNADFDFLFFGEEPTVASAQNSAIDISNSEMTSKFVGAVSIRSCGASQQYIELANSSCLAANGLDLIMTRARSSDGINHYKEPHLWVVMVIRSDDKTFLADDLQINFGFRVL